MCEWSQYIRIVPAVRRLISLILRYI